MTVSNKKIIYGFKQHGVAALLVVVIVGVTALVLALNSSLLGLGALEEGYSQQAGSETFSVADGCLEEVLRRIRLDENYGLSISPFTLSAANGSCTIYIEIGGTAQERNIEINGNIGEYNKKIYTKITTANSVTTGVIITVDLWQEVSVLNNI